MHAARLVAIIREEFGVDPAVMIGPAGRFDVLLNGELVAERSNGFMNRLLGLGLPDATEVVRALRRRIEGRDGVSGHDPQEER